MKNILVIFVLLLSACTTAPSEQGATGEAPASPNANFAGKYIGNYYGDDTGTLSLEIDEHGRLNWEGSGESRGGFSVSGVITYTDNKWMLKGSTNDGAMFQAFLQDEGVFSGTWENPNPDQNGLTKQGSFDVRKISD